MEGTQLIIRFINWNNKHTSVEQPGQRVNAMKMETVTDLNFRLNDGVIKTWHAWAAADWHTAQIAEQKETRNNNVCIYILYTLMTSTAATDFDPELRRIPVIKV